MCDIPRPLRLSYISTRIAATLLLLAAVDLAAPYAVVADEPSATARRTYSFDDGATLFTADFSAARLNNCTEVADDQFELLIRPENVPINDSAWFAFQVRTEQPRTITFRLAYEGGTHRYVPLVSDDRATWAPIEPLPAEPDAEPEFPLQIGSGPRWVAAQELIDVAATRVWIEDLARRPFVTAAVIGRSVAGRPIQRLRITETDRPAYVFIIARQHPPEVTGAIGMMRFVEVLAGDSPLARQFRKRFCVVVVPLMNPDGVENGHWRHNLNGVDLNRDWGKFTQPETCAARDELLSLGAKTSGKLFLFLDFHSTHHDVFYTQPEAAHTFPENFTDLWLEGLDRRFADYQVQRDDSHNASPNTSKAWVHEKFGVPAITYEFGDNTDREQIHRLAAGAAEEMMRQLLVAKEDGK